MASVVQGRNPVLCVSVQGCVCARVCERASVQLHLHWSSERSESGRLHLISVRLAWEPLAVPVFSSGFTL